MNTRVIDLANEICMRARVAKSKSLCTCGKPAVVRGRCRGCDEDKFYRRDVPGAKTEGAE